MKKSTILGVLLVAFATSALWADQINLNFTTGALGSIVASKAGGMSSGPSELISISDSTTSVIVPFDGTYVRGNTGPASSFVIGTLVIATFTGDGPNSVFVIDSGSTTLVSGIMRDGSSLLSTFPAGTGSFLGTFDVTSVNPSVLALFGLPPAFEPVGSVAFTFANASVSAGVLTGAIGGGAVTIQTPTPTPEIGTMFLLGTGLFAAMTGMRRFNKTA